MTPRRTDILGTDGAGGARKGPRTYERAYRTGLDLLARRDHSTRRLGEKLARRGFSRTVIERVLGEFRRRGYLDDLRLATAFLVSGSEHKLLGRARLERDLLRHGFDAETVREALQRHRNAVDEDRILDSALRRYLERRGPLSDAAAARKGYDHLLRRGFSPGAIRRALEPHLEAAGFRDHGRRGPVEGE